MPINSNKLFYAGLIACLLLGCSAEKSIQLSGLIDYVGSAELYISKQPIHYKYADKNRFPVTAKDNGKFRRSIPLDSTQIIEFHIDDQSYPIVAQPGWNLDLEISRSHFPDSVEVSGYPEPWDRRYAQYRNDVQAIQQQIGNQLAAFRQGKPTEIPSLYEKRYTLAGKYVKDTPLDDIYYKTVGEYLVKRLEEIKYRRKQSGFDAEKARQQVLSKAQKLNFFTFESLHAQRAGIRDFTNAFANTFGVAESLEKKHDQKLTKYDVKRLGYQKLDSARTAVLPYIKERRAKAYARMHLVAERIGSMPLDVATPSYKKFLQEYSGFPRYISFLKTFFRQIKRVSPGQPAVPFTLPNKNGERVQLKDFRGKYLLLDFWASWCIPCLDEFPHMKELYQKYPRDKFEIAAISIEKDSLRWRRAIKRFDNPWPQLYGGNGFQQQTFQTYRGGGIPFYILVGPKGDIIRYNDVRPSFNLPELLDSLITPSRNKSN